MTNTSTTAQLHIRYDGGSTDVDLHEVDLGDLSSDQDIRTAAAVYLNVPASKFDSFVVDTNDETGDITLRPQAVFG